MPWSASIDVLAAPLLNHAMVQGGLPFCRRIEVRPSPAPGDEDRPVDLVVEATVRDAHGDTVSRPWRRHEPQWIGADVLTVDDPGILLEGAWISSVEEESRCELAITVPIDGVECAQAHLTQRVLGARHWGLDPHDTVLSVQLLAAFVQPNDPLVQEILHEAAVILEKRTGSGSLGVSTAEEERRDRIVDALLEAIHARDIYYAQPPVSWHYGQRVRTPEEVLRGGTGTCLDTSVVVAAAIEAVGLAPTIWIAEGHAFVGYWRGQPTSLDAVSLDTRAGVNAVDLNRMAVIETTMLTRERRPPRDLTRRVRQAPRDTYFHTSTGELVALVDVAMARMLQITPLPSRRRRADGTVEVVEYRAPAISSGSGSGTATGPPAGRPADLHVAEEVPARVQAWKNALLDLSLRNRLLNLEMARPAVRLLLPPDHLGALAGPLQDGRSITLRAVDEVNDAAARQHTRDAYALPHDVVRSLLVDRSTCHTIHDAQSHRVLLDRLRQRGKSGVEESGSNPLVLALGRVVWTLGERELHAPLVILPVEIKGLVRPYRLSADPAGSATLNLSLLEKLRLEFGFTLPDLDLPARADGEGVDVEEVVRRVRGAFEQAGLPFTVASDATLMVSSFTGYLLWRDLEAHWREFTDKPIVHHLVHTPLESLPEPEGARQASDTELDALVADLPVLADGSQAEAIAAAAAGRSFVLEGPPGTGKSQTITNVIAHQLAQGRTVLFVAEKGAALDVVRRRLDAIGLEPFVLDLHNQAAGPTQVRAQLRRSLAHQVTSDEAGRRAAESRLTSSAARLAAHRDSVHATGWHGHSLWSARQHHLALGDGASLRLDGLARTPVEPDTVRHWVAGLVPALSQLGGEDAHVWGFAARFPSDPPALLAALQHADEAVEAVLADVLPEPDHGAGHPVAPARRLLREASDPASLEALVDLLADDRADLADIGSPRWLAATERLLHDIDTVAREGRDLLAIFTDEVLDLDLDPVRTDLRLAEASFFIGRKGRLLRAADPLLRTLRPGAVVPAAQLTGTVERLVGLRHELDRLAATMTSIPGLRAPAGRADLAADPQQVARGIEAARARAARLGGLPPQVRDEVLALRASGGGLPARDLSLVAAASGAITSSLAAVAAVPDLVAGFAGADGLLPAWSRSAPGRARDLPSLAALRRWTAAVGDTLHWPPSASGVRWQLLTGDVRPEEAEAALERGLVDLATTERWESLGLAGFSRERHDGAVAEFTSASAGLRDLATSSLPERLIARRPFGHGSRLGAVGALEREVGRSRGGLSVRRLLATHGEVIAAATPCVLVSPDSLARFLAPGAITFDLVVFDEASQIRVPDAIGALGRARAALIAGDSQQMPPTAFAQVSREDEEEDVVPDEESILSEAVQAGFERRWLSWHYRSRDESLIAFSNRSYYEGRLASFPSYWSQISDTGVSFTRVPGHFVRSRDESSHDQADPDSIASEETAGEVSARLRTNPVEASAVVQEVLRRWRASEHSIGVVTFNAPQQSLIIDMLWDSEEPGLRESLAGENASGEGIFVKNLENVQGDERDIIIFSVGFSADATGRLPLNFGPLNRAGGHRRLNVAITRARRRVMVFASFDPEDIRVEGTSARGVHDLHGFLLQARDGQDRADVESITPAADRHRHQVAEALRAHGCGVTEDVGLSDFRVDLLVSPAGQQEPRMAVLLDGPRWSLRRTIADRDALPVDVLHGLMGWPCVARVWLPAWLEDPEGVIAHLIAAMSDAPETDVIGTSMHVHSPADTCEVARADTGGESQPEDATSSTQGAAAPEPATVELPAEPELATMSATREQPDGPRSTYQPASPEAAPKSRLDGVGSRESATRSVQEMMRSIVATEGPVSVPRLARLVVAAHGISRLQETRIASLRPHIPADLRRDAEGFVWPPERDPLRWQGYRPSDDTKNRGVAEVALREIGNAMLDLARRAMAISREDLLTESARIFGHTRVTAPVRARLESALAEALRDGRLVIGGTMIRPGREP